MFLGGNLLAWRSRKQFVVATSSTVRIQSYWFTISEVLSLKVILDDLTIKITGHIKL